MTNSFRELKLVSKIDMIMFYNHVIRYIEDICFFEVNTKYISSSELKTLEFSRVRSTSENVYFFKQRDEIYLVFTEKKCKFSFFIQYMGIFQFTRQAVKMKKKKKKKKKKNQRTIGPENAHLKPDVGAFSLLEMTLTLNTRIPLRTSLVVCIWQVSGLRLQSFWEDILVKHWPL